MLKIVLLFGFLALASADGNYDLFISVAFVLVSRVVSCTKVYS